MNNATRTHDLITAFKSDGYVLQLSVFDNDEVALLREAATRELSVEGPRRTTDGSTGEAYRVHGSHRHDAVFDRLVRDERLAGTAGALIGEDVYVHQFKINRKAAYTGEAWGWHQDFAFWHAEDKMVEPLALSVAIFLDDVTEFNGPLILTPGGHSAGLIRTPARSDGWDATLTNDLKYTLEDSPTFGDLVAQSGLRAPKGPSGSVLWFHCTMPHASGQNVSPYERSLALVSYNAVRNALPAVSPRVEWMASRDFAAIEPVSGRLTTDALC